MRILGKAADTLASNLFWAICLNVILLAILLGCAK